MNDVGAASAAEAEAPPVLAGEVKLEVVAIPVSDVDRAKDFYVGLGWRLDADFAEGDFRVVQLTPPGSACSIHFGRNVTAAAPGSAQGLHLAVADVEAARAGLAGRGVEITEVYHCAAGISCRFEPVGTDGRAAGREPAGTTYGSFASFTDPDGNGWILQEISERLPGR